jgi:hypothetical protein
LYLHGKPRTLRNTIYVSGLALALALALALRCTPAWAQVVIQSDDDTPPPPPTSTATPPPPAPTSTAAPPPAPVPTLANPPGSTPAPPADTTGKTTVDVGAGGLTATKETAERVKEPPSSTVNVAFDFGGGTILGIKDITLGFVNLDLKVKILAGGQFPGSDGGSWNGIFVEPQASLMLLIDSYSQPTVLAGAQFPGKNTTDVIFGFQAGAAVGWQFLTFGPMSEGGLKQHGFGLALGGYLGATGINPPQGSMQINASYGPEVVLSFPTYNAGTASYKAFNVTLFVLPSGDGSVLLSAGLGWIF